MSDMVPQAITPDPAAEAEKVRKAAEQQKQEEGSSTVETVLDVAADCLDIAGTAAEAVGSVVGAVLGGILDA
ncbi:MAG: hypothetical protein K2X74_11125 [Acetobacteraceae bacterium]|nr:hypothetical protein [Acetobacteraceae bacterium]